MVDQNPLHPEFSSSINYSDDTQKVRRKGAPYTHRTSREANMYWSRSVQPYTTQSINKNPLNPHKNGSSDQVTREVDTKQWYSSTRSGTGNLSYFPDHVARVSYVASIVESDPNGDYLLNLQDGMDLLATRLAPSYFPGTVVLGVTTQVDGYFPASEFWIESNRIESHWNRINSLQTICWCIVSIYISPLFF